MLRDIHLAMDLDLEMNNKHLYKFGYSEGKKIRSGSGYSDGYGYGHVGGIGHGTGYACGSGMESSFGYKSGCRRGFFEGGPYGNSRKFKEGFINPIHNIYE